MAKKHDYRIKVLDPNGVASYIVRERGKVSYISQSLKPLTLADIADDAADLTFALQDAHDGRMASREVRHAVRPALNLSVAEY